MLTLLRRIAFALLTLSISWPALAQDCNSVILENKKISGTQIVRTSSLTIVVRGSYNYSIEFFTDEKGVFARMISQGGIEFNQDDLVIFVDNTGREQTYKFFSMGEVGTGSVPTHKNNLRLDLDAIQWLSESNITGINFVNFVDRQKYKFTINPNKQVEFKNLVTCFNSSLDKGAVVDTPGAAVA
ncbi:MAG TPA: hypothetical protein PKL15_10375, partial [Saprospiraceae bacterium]|nr:hypothetical protein [Saprospiraceae bacterium]